MGEDGKKDWKDFLKTGPARGIGSVLFGTGYALKGPEAVEKVYDAGKKGVEKVVTYAKVGAEKINLKTGTQGVASGLLAVLTYKLTGKAFDNYDGKKEEK